MRSGTLTAICTGLVLAGIFAYLGCSEDGPTAPTFEETPAPTVVHNDPPSSLPDDDSSEEPRQAEGELVIRGNYGECRQTTSYPRNYLSIFRVSNSGAQNRIELYRSGEGAIPCGFLIQVDCTVRDPDPDARPSAYDLYDHFIGTLECRPTPPGPPPPPPPTCDAEELQQLAAEECGELGVKLIDFGACTFECNQDNGSCEPDPPPAEDCELLPNCTWECPPCDLEELENEAAAACEFGVDFIDFEQCTFGCLPDPCVGEPTECPEGKILVEGEVCNECRPFCDVFPDSDECASVAWCHVASPPGKPDNPEENDLNIPLSAIQGGHIGANGNIGDGGYPHCNWKHETDYVGPCDGRGLTADSCSSVN